MSLKKDYNSILNVVGDNLSNESGGPMKKVAQAMEEIGFQGFTLQDQLDNMYVLRTTEVNGTKQVTQQSLKAYLWEFDKRPDVGPAPTTSDERLVRQEAAIGNAVISGALYYHDKDFNKVYALGLSNDKEGEITAYEDKNGYNPQPPEKPSLLKRVLSVFGIFRDEVNRYNRKLAEYNDAMNDRADQKLFEEASTQIKADLHEQHEARKRAAETEINGPQLKADFEKAMGSVDRALAMRKLEGSRFPDVQAKLDALTAADPIRIARNEAIKEAYEENSVELKYVDNLLPDPSLAAELYPMDCVPTASQADGFIFNKIYTLSQLVKENQSEIPDSTRELLQRNIGILNKNFEKAGITDKTEITAKSPNVAQVMITAADNLKRAQAMSLVSEKLADMIGKTAGTNSTEYIELKAMEVRAKGMADFCKECRALDGSAQKPICLSEKLAVGEKSAVISEEKQEEFHREMENLGKSRAPSPTEELKNIIEIGDTDSNAMKTRALLTAEIVVSVMGKNNPWPDSVDTRLVAKQLSEREFRGSCFETYL